ncbi:MAG: NAD-binding protein [Actinomycetota bacterium]
MTILVGGTPGGFEAHAALLGLLGRTLHVGPLGAGAAVKLAANAAAISSLVGVAEVLTLTDRAGLDPGTVLDALGAGPLSSLIARWRDRILDASGETNFRLALARKDLELVLDEAGRVGIELRVPGAAATRFDDALSAGRGEDDFSSVATSIRS